MEDRREDISALVEGYRNGHMRGAPIFRKALEEELTRQRKEPHAHEDLARPRGELSNTRSTENKLRQVFAGRRRISASASAISSAPPAQERAPDPEMRALGELYERLEAIRAQAGSLGSWAEPAGPSCSLRSVRRRPPLQPRVPAVVPFERAEPPLPQPYSEIPYWEEAAPQEGRSRLRTVAMICLAALVLGGSAAAVLWLRPWEETRPASSAAAVEPAFAAVPAQAAPQPGRSAAGLEESVQARKDELVAEAMRLINSPDVVTAAAQQRIDEIFAEVDRLEAAVPADTASSASADTAASTIATAAMAGPDDVTAFFALEAAAPAAGFTGSQAAPVSQGANEALESVDPSGSPAQQDAAASSIPGTVIHLRVGAGTPASARKRVETALAQAGYGAVVLHELPFSISRSRVAYFREEDRHSAQALAAALDDTLTGVELRDYRKLLSQPEPGRLDLWLGNPTPAE